MANHKKTKKKHHMRRNAVAAAAPLPRAIARFRRSSLSEQLEAEKEKLEAEKEKLEAEKKKQAEDTRGWRLVNGVGGMLATSALGILLEHQDTLPTTWVTAGLTGLGGAFALAAPNKALRSIGLGAALAGTTLLATQADRAWFPREGKAADHPQVASSSGAAKPPAPGKKQSNATDIPADALARAYERARLRMALASEPTN